jgi:hypothetical protein
MIFFNCRIKVPLFLQKNTTACGEAKHITKNYSNIRGKAKDRLRASLPIQVRRPAFIKLSLGKIRAGHCYVSGACFHLAVFRNDNFKPPFVILEKPTRS